MSFDTTAEMWFNTFGFVKSNERYDAEEYPGYGKTIGGVDWTLATYADKVPTVWVVHTDNFQGVGGDTLYRFALYRDGKAVDIYDDPLDAIAYIEDALGMTGDEFGRYTAILAAHREKDAEAAVQDLDELLNDGEDPK